MNVYLNNYDMSVSGDPERRFAGLVNNVNLGILRSLPEPPVKVIEANRAMETITGYTRKELLEMDFSKLYMNKKDREDLLNDLLNSSLGEIIRELRWKKKNGTEILIQIRSTIVRDDNGKIVCFDAIVEDITEKKRMERALLESEEFNSSLLNNSPGPIIVINPDTSIRYVNPAFEEITDFPSSLIIGRRIPYPWWPPETQNRIGEMFLRAMKEGATKVEELFRKKGGGSFWVEMTSKPIEVNGILKYYLEVWNDINDRKLIEQEVNKYQNKLRSLASELSLAEERERRRIAEEVHDRVVQSLAITSMKLSALMKEQESVHISQSLEDMNVLINKLIKEARSLCFELSSPLLYEIGFEAAIEGLVERVCEQHNLMYEFQDDGRNRSLNQESCVLLYQAVRELLINVVKHARADTVKLSIYRKYSNVNISVSDNGIGFSHLQHEKRLYSRQGFGLFAINERIRNIGGRFELVSEPNHGTQITLSVPFKSSGG